MNAPLRNRTAATPVNVVTLRLDGEILAIPTACLREILEPVQITRVPQAPAFVDGLINVRGAVVPLADLRVAFGMAQKPADEDTRILVLELDLGGTPTVAGILADGVHEVTELDPRTLEDIPSVGTRWPPDFVDAIGKWNGGFVMLPNLVTIFETHLAGQGAHTASE